MKILHSSDWHLGKKLENFSRLPEQILVLNEICDIADSQDVDAVLLAGDLFDSFNPPVEAIELFYKTLKRLSKNGSRAVVAIAGNHDSPDRVSAPNPLARECGIILIGYPNEEIIPFELQSGLKVKASDKGFIELELPKCDQALRIIHTPYANGLRLKTYLGTEDSEDELRQILQTNWAELVSKYCDTKGVNLLMTHLFVHAKGETNQEEPDDEKPILHIGGAQAIHTENIPDEIQYTALGHLHRRHNVGTDDKIIMYSGTPLSYSFAEANQDKYVVIIDVKAGEKPNVNNIKLQQGRALLRKTIEGVDKAVEWLEQNKEALIELTMLTDTYLSAEDRKLLAQTHSRIISLIPEVKNKELQDNSQNKGIDLSKNMEDLFYEYFEYANKGQKPNERIKNLFKEILSEEDK